MKNSNIPIYRRKKEILNKNTLINPNEESENKKLESENKPIRISLDNNLIIDESVYDNINQMLLKNPAWQSILMTARSPGHFILTG